tara:strand:- start:134 stop:712 length:579 start_codon:yes stop_codon:yes gene_type:complete
MISRKAFNIFSFLILTLVLIQNDAFSDTKFKIMDMEPIRLDVKNIIIKDLYSISFQDPFVEHRMRRSPSDGLIGWTRTILRPVGSDGVATFSILEASASLSSITSDFKFLDLFKNKQTTKITIKLLGKLEIEKQGNNQTGYLDIFASSNKTAPESASISQLEYIWDNSLNIAIGKFDEEFRKQIQSMSQFLK